MTGKIKEQILKIRDTGRTNMFDIVMVQRIAYELKCYELVEYLITNKGEYTHFILTGK